MKIQLKNSILALACVSSMLAFSQEEKVDSLNLLDQRITSVEDGLFQLKKLKFSGYIQAQWQSSKLDSLGNKTNDMKNGLGKNGPESLPGVGSYNRYGVRRGRLKATYEDFGCQAVVEFDISEGGLKTKDLYLNVLDPWVNTFAIKGGVFDRPFGSEIAYSSSKLESPERSRIIQTLFPDEKDLGSMLTIQAPKTSPWNVLKLEAGLLSGNAISKDYKSKKDFAAHLTYNKALASMKYGFGVSMYSGYILQSNANVYTMSNGAFALDNTASNKNSFADRSYFGVDGQFSIASDLGLSSIRAEFITGTQPGTSGSSASPNGYDPTVGNTAIYDVTGAKTTSYIAGFVPADTYIRKFRGGYVNFVQDIAGTKHSIVVKYDWYDPNTKVSGSQVGIAAKTGKADMAYSTLGLGYLYRLNTNVRLMAYYDMVSNEKTSVKGYFSNVKDNLVTVRFQYKF